MRLCFALEHDQQPPLGPSDLKHLSQLAQLVLEMPIPDTSIILRQERPGAEHLALLLAGSGEHPAVLGPDGETFVAMPVTYRQLRGVLER
eukprot:CAMPEP_0173454330 /NCGR_PEP_ID=MMETSP1357-20121228/52197_1 /TAXON_ID=77926 /ORGANISM="Hemiselmis rufescens, Strain PCC563" /LENGTH=89 /DNA_ID=CAMNT_0014421349 /DNA_START=1 /DNA_END=267 /DNA_ORIENTATION=+